MIVLMEKKELLGNGTNRTYLSGWRRKEAHGRIPGFELFFMSWDEIPAKHFLQLKNKPGWTVLS